MVFICNKCGICCKELRSLHACLTPEQLEEFKNSVQQKNLSGPIYCLASQDMFTFIIFEQEIEPLQRAARDNGIELKIKPYTAFYDDYANTWVVLNWFLDHDDCPFLTDSGCSVYNIRPLACRAFPIQPKFFMEEGSKNNISVSDVFGTKCPLISRDFIGRGVRDLLSDFGECVVAAKTFASRCRYQREMIDIAVSNSFWIRLHRGRMPLDKEHYQPAIEYLSKLGTLKKNKLEIWKHVGEKG